MSKSLKVVVALAAVVASGSASAQVIATRTQLNTLLGSGQTFEDFEKFTNTSQISGAGTLNAANNWASQGTGKVVSGVNFSSNGGTGSMFLNVNGYFGLSTHTLGDSLANRPIDVAFTVPVTAFGLDLQSYNCCGTTGLLSVFDTAGALLGTFNVAGGINGAGNFFGYQSSVNIGSFTIAAATNNYIMLDNLGFGVAGGATAAVPEPATWAMMLAGFGFAGFAMRRRATVRRTVTFA